MIYIQKYTIYSRLLIFFDISHPPPITQIVREDGVHPSHILDSRVQMIRSVEFISQCSNVHSPMRYSIMQKQTSRSLNDGRLSSARSRDLTQFSSITLFYVHSFHLSSPFSFLKSFFIHPFGSFSCLSILSLSNFFLISFRQSRFFLFFLLLFPHSSISSF